MNNEEIKELKEYFDFLDSVVYDSPHCCDDETMAWHEKMMKVVMDKFRYELYNFNQVDESSD